MMLQSWFSFFFHWSSPVLCSLSCTMFIIQCVYYFVLTLLQEVEDEDQSDIGFNSAASEVLLVSKAPEIGAAAISDGDEEINIDDI